MCCVSTQCNYNADDDIRNAECGLEPYCIFKRLSNFDPIVSL